VREIRSLGSVRGVRSNSYPYRDTASAARTKRAALTNLPYALLSCFPAYGKMKEKKLGRGEARKPTLALCSQKGYTCSQNEYDIHCVV
jgi:hypothetical protein